jgi:hypothetical protein
MTMNSVEGLRSLLDAVSKGKLSPDLALGIIKRSKLRKGR